MSDSSILERLLRCLCALVFLCGLPFAAAAADRHTESDATRRMIIPPTAMVGPDDVSKRDNHVNPDGARDDIGRALHEVHKTP